MPDNITPVDQFEQDIEFIRTTDKVLGDPPGTQGALSGPINKVLQKIANSLLNLKTRLDGLNITVPNASTTTKGIAELITKTEVERTYDNADTTRIVPAKRIHDLLRHANAQATDLIRGTVLLANETQAQDDSNGTHALTAASLYRHVTKAGYGNGNLEGAKPTEDVATHTSTTYSGGDLFFGPIRYDSDFTIQIDGRVTTSTGIVTVDGHGINVDVPSDIDITKWDWSIKVTNVVSGGWGNNHTLQIAIVGSKLIFGGGPVRTPYTIDVRITGVFNINK